MLQGAERRGVGLNRVLHALLEYCNLQMKETTKKQNEFCLQEGNRDRSRLSLMYPNSI